MRAQHGARFWWVSLFTVFLLQAALAWVVSLPLQAAVASTTPLGILDGVGVLAWIAGFTCEAVADAQLARFRANPSSRGTVLDTGLWRYSRHPNYFGDALLWWGIGLLGAAAGAWAALVGPLLMNVLIVRVSGVSLLEKDIGDRRPGYREYVRRTSSFVPWFPKG
jgi:steroid 5-alpha reductase family enzyme